MNQTKTQPTDRQINYAQALSSQIAELRDRHNCDPADLCPLYIDGRIFAAIRSDYRPLERHELADLDRSLVSRLIAQLKAELNHQRNKWGVK